MKKTLHNNRKHDILLIQIRLIKHNDNASYALIILKRRKTH